MDRIIKKAFSVQALMPCFCAVALFVLLCARASATPISTTPTYSFAGNINFVGTGGSMRTQSNWGNPCAIGTSSTQALSGIPPTATIRAAFLYWCHSGTTTDTRVRLNGTWVDATRTFSEVFNYGGTNYNFRGGFADVTTIVNATRNGNYTFRGLTVSNGNPWCAVQAVVGGWALLVIYEDSSEKQRVINIFDGLQYFRYSSITLTPNNFVVSDIAGIDGKIGHISWEGDPTLTGPNEYFSFNGNILTDANNPATDQYNSTISHLGTLISGTAYGLDYDIYDISSYLTAGDTSGTAVYSADGDLVLLNCEVISVTSRASDLAITKTHTGNFASGGTGDFTITVANNGPDAQDGVVTVTDVLPAGLTYNSFSGTGWSVDTSGAPTIVFTYDCTSSPVPSGSSLPALTLTVNVGTAAVPGVSNTATVSSTAFDNISSNDSSTDTVTVTTGPDLLVVKSVTTISDPVSASNPKAIPGAVMLYTIQVTNEGAGATDSDTVVVTDAIPANTKMYVGDLGTGPVLFIDGSSYGGTNSGLTYNFVSLGDGTDDLAFSNDNGATYTYTPTPDADNCDSAITNIRVNPKGQINGASGGNQPSFQLRFQVQVK